MRKRLATLALASVLALSGCSAVRSGLAKIGWMYEDHKVTICATGAETIQCTDAGTIPVPLGGILAARIVEMTAKPFLAQHAKLDGCIFTTYDPIFELRKTTISASAVCKENGVEVSEVVEIILEPVTPAPVTPAPAPAPTPA